MAISFDTSTGNNYNSYLTDSVHSVVLRIIRIAHLYMRRCKDHIFSEGQDTRLRHICNQSEKCTQGSYLTLYTDQGARQKLLMTLMFSFCFNFKSIY